MSKSVRKLGDDSEATPGPAFYAKKFITKRGPRAAIPQGKRDLQKSQLQMPGPADYSESMFRSQGPKFIIGIKTGALLEKRK